MTNKRTIEHFKGCIIGGAIGDTLIELELEELIDETAGDLFDQFG
jgi:hypothetical protein